MLFRILRSLFGEARNSEMILSCSEVFHGFHNDLFGICFFSKGVIKSVTAFEIEQRRMDVSTRRRCVSYKSVRQK